MISIRTMILSAGVVATAALSPHVAVADKVEIHMAFSRNPELYADLAKEFEAQHPDIRIVMQSGGYTYDDLTQVVLRGAVVSDLPDIAVGSVNQIRLFADRRLIQPMTELIAADPEWPSLGYMKSAEQAGQVEGQQFGLPFGVAETVVFYNADLVRKAGGDPDHFPTDWDGILALGARINALGGMTQGFYMSHYEHTSFWTFTTLLNSAGGELLSPDEKKVTFNGPEGVWALDMFRRFASEAGQTDMSLEQARQSFSAGTLGIFASSSSILGAFEKNIGISFDFRIAPWPIPSPKGYLPGAGNAIMLFAKDPEKQKAAFEFIKFAVGPEGQTLIPKYTGYAPNNEIAIRTPELLGNVYASNPRQKIILEQLKNTKGWFAFPGNIATRVDEVMRDGILDVTTLKRTPEEVMPEMATRVQGMLDNQ